MHRKPIDFTWPYFVIFCKECNVILCEMYWCENSQVTQICHDEQPQSFSVRCERWNMCVCVCFWGVCSGWNDSQLTAEMCIHWLCWKPWSCCHFLWTSNQFYLLIDIYIFIFFFKYTTFVQNIKCLHKLTFLLDMPTISLSVQKLRKKHSSRICIYYYYLFNKKLAIDNPVY